MLYRKEMIKFMSLVESMQMFMTFLEYFIGISPGVKLPHLSRVYHYFSIVKRKNILVVSIL